LNSLISGVSVGPLTNLFEKVSDCNNPDAENRSLANPHSLPEKLQVFFSHLKKPPDISENENSIEDWGLDPCTGERAFYNYEKY
jgi:hypothetical protein